MAPTGREVPAGEKSPTETTRGRRHSLGALARIVDGAVVQYSPLDLRALRLGIRRAEAAMPLPERPAPRVRGAL